MASLFYPTARAGILGGTINLLTDPIYVMLTTEAYVPDQSHQFKSQVVGESSGTGYPAGGATLVNRRISVVTAGDVQKAVLNADPVNLGEATVTARSIVVYVKGATDATSKLIGCLDLGKRRGVENMNFGINFDGGIVSF